jgi:arylsulfatase
MYYTMSQSGAAGWLLPLVPYHFTLVQNIKRDPFEQYVLPGQDKSLMSFGGALASPSTAYLYNWNILPIGQQLWLKELESYKGFPPLQAPEIRSSNRSRQRATSANRPTKSQRKSKVTGRSGAPAPGRRRYVSEKDCLLDTQTVPLYRGSALCLSRRV